MAATLLLTGVLALLGTVAVYAVVRGLQWFLAVVTDYPELYELARTSAGRLVAATGSPAALASALETLTHADWPDRNRRARSAIGAFAIVPEEPPEPIRMGPDSEREPAFADVERTAHRIFRMRPTLERRLDALGALTEEMERAG